MRRRRSRVCGPLPGGQDKRADNADWTFSWQGHPPGIVVEPPHELLGKPSLAQSSRG